LARTVAKKKRANETKLCAVPYLSDLFKTFDVINGREGACRTLNIDT
jgi:hypothetical protein